MRFKRYQARQFCHRKDDILARFIRHCKAFVEQLETLPLGLQPVLTRTQKVMVSEFWSGHTALNGNTARLRFYSNDHLPGRENKPCRGTKQDKKQRQRRADYPPLTGG